MSDNGNSTGSSGSSTNSWTLLSPEEVDVENAAPVDDGSESLADVPSLSEEVAGTNFKPCEIQTETVLSEEGHQVCQETSPEGSGGPIPPSPTRCSPLPLHPIVLPELDPESQPPIIHDIVTSSPSDNEQLGAVPFVTNMNLGAPLDIHVPEVPVTELEFEPQPESELEPEIHPASDPSPDRPVLDKPTDPESDPKSCVVGDPVPVAEPEVSIPTETITPSVPPSAAGIHASTSAECSVEVPVSQQSAESPSPDTPVPETIGPTEEAEEQAVEKETVLLEKTSLDECEEASEEPWSRFDFAKGDSSSDDDGLRRRRAPPFEPQRPRTSDEEDEEEEGEFRMAEHKEGKRCFSLNKCIVGALVLLFLGSLFLSDDFDSSELNDGEQSQHWHGDGMEEILDKLAQENQKISQLEAKLQSQKEELDLALKAATVKGDEKGQEDLEKENARMKNELSSLPGLRDELEALRARVTELTQLTANQEVVTTSPPSAPHPGRQPGNSNLKPAESEKRADPKQEVGLKDELRRQRDLLEESKNRLQGMRSEGGVRDDLQKIRKRLSEQVERLERKKPWEPKRNERRGEGGSRDHRKKDDRKEWRNKKDQKPGEEGGVGDKEEERSEGRDRKPHKQNSHKEAWRKQQGAWERGKEERTMDRKERRKQEAWQSPPTEGGHRSKLKHSHQQEQHHQHQPHKPWQHDHNLFWGHQREKLRRNVRPRPGCSSVESCAGKEGLYPVEFSEFEELLEGYLSKLEGSPSESRDAIRKLTAEFFEKGVFIHDRVPFGDFAEDVADILEDMADLLEDGRQGDDDALEEEMEEFEREALWKFSATA